MDEDVRLQQAIKAIDEMLILTIAQNLRTPFFDDPNKDANLEATYRFTPSNGIAKWGVVPSVFSLVKCVRSTSHIMISLKKEQFWSEDLFPAIQSHYANKYGFKEVKIGIKGPVIAVAFFCDTSHSPSQETIEKAYGSVEENPLLAERDDMYVAFCDKRMEVLGVHRSDQYEKVDKAILYEGDHGLPLVWCFRLKTKAPVYTEKLEELIRSTAKSTYYDLCFSPVYYRGEYARAGIPLRQEYSCEWWWDEDGANSVQKVSFTPSPNGLSPKERSPHWARSKDGKQVWRYSMEAPVGLDEEVLEALAWARLVLSRLPLKDESISRLEGKGGLDAVR